MNTNTSGTANLTQDMPDATGTSHFNGSFTFPNNPCFTSGTVSNGVLLGNVVQATITTDTGQIAFGCTFFSLDPMSFSGDIREVAATFVVTGGPCNGQTLKVQMLP